MPDDGADVALTDSAFLVSADPARVAPLLGRARDERARLAAAAYGTSWHLHRSAAARVRRDLLAVDAARFGDAGLAARIAAVPLPSAPAAAWTVGWATGAYVDRRLRFRLSGVDRAVVATAVVDGRLVAVTIAGGALIRVWDVSTRTLVNSWAAEPERVLFAVATAMLHERPVVLTAGESTCTWDLETGTPLSAVVTAGRRGDVTGVAAATVHGRPVAISAGPGGLRMSDLATGAAVGDPIDLDWSTTVAVAMLDGRPAAVTHDALTNPSVPVWDLTTARPAGPLMPSGEVSALAVAELGGRAVAIAGDWDGVLRVWDLASAQPAGAPMTGHSGAVTAVATAVFGGRNVVVTGGQDATVRVWDPVTGRQAGPETTFPAQIDGLVAVPGGGLIVAVHSELVALTGVPGRTSDAPDRGHPGPLA